MKKIKIITAPGVDALQKHIDKWIDEVNPYIDSASAITHNPGSLSHMISIVYSESPLDLDGN
jgi:hypothetical protein